MKPSGHAAVLFSGLELTSAFAHDTMKWNMIKCFRREGLTEMNHADRRTAADRILYDFGLLGKLEEIGKAHIIGSYRMNTMAWNDLDIDIENDRMSMEMLYDLTAFIIETFRPVWYEAKEEKTETGTVWFHGFETTITGELWNVDLWFLDRETILQAEQYCDDIARRMTQAQKDVTVHIKQELIQRGLYSFEKYKSIDIYSAVLDKGVTSIDEFLNCCPLI